MTNPDPSHLTIDNLHKRYGDVVALNGVRFTAAPGRICGFLGQNGAGKTTTMRSIFGLIEPDSGTVNWNGQPVTRDQLQHFGYMPEERGLYPKMRILDQLIYFGQLQGLSRAEAKQRGTKWLNRLGLGERMKSKVQELSQGNQQRVQLAVSLIHNPSVLVLDEPFNGLDPMAAATMADVLRELAGNGAIIVFSSHQLDMVEDLCDDVAIIKNGTTVTTGSVQQLRADAPWRVVDIPLTEAEANRIAGLEGIKSMTFDGTVYRLHVDPSVSADIILSQREPNSPLQQFSYDFPSLDTIFKEYVA